MLSNPLPTCNDRALRDELEFLQVQIRAGLVGDSDLRDSSEDDVAELRQRIAEVNAEHRALEAESAGTRVLAEKVCQLQLRLKEEREAERRLEEEVKRRLKPDLPNWALTDAHRREVKAQVYYWVISVIAALGYLFVVFGGCGYGHGE